MPYRVLVVLAMPVDQAGMQANREAAEIKKQLRGCPYDVEFSPATTVAELHDELLRHKPEILHFAGHGTQSGLLFENDDGESRLVRPEEMATLLRQCRKRLYAVVMNACYSSTNAKEFRTTGIPYLISMSDEIDDEGAVAFSRAFYVALGTGEDIESAYEHGFTAYDEKIAEHAPDEEPPKKAAEVLQLPVKAKQFRKCKTCESLIIGRLRGCKFCKRWPDTLKAVAAVLVMTLAGYAGYAQWFVEPRIEFVRETDDGELLYFRLINDSLEPVVLSSLTVNDPELAPSVKIGNLKPKSFPKVGWREESEFAVNVNQVWWQSPQHYATRGRYLDDRAKKTIEFRVKVKRDDQELELAYPVEVERLRKFLTIGHGTPDLAGQGPV